MASPDWSPPRPITPPKRTGFGRRAFDVWKAFARTLAGVQPRIVLTLLYFAALAPFACVVRWVSDPLEIKAARSSAWKTRPAPDGSDLQKVQKQY